MNECDLLGIASVVFQKRHAILKPQVAVHAIGQLSQLRRRVDVELTREQVVAGDGQRGHEGNEYRCIRQREAGPKPYCSHGACSDNMYPTPRIV